MFKYILWVNCICILQARGPGSALTPCRILELRENMEIGQCIIYNNRYTYSDNQKTMEKKDDLIGILTRFEVVTKQIFLIVTQRSTTEVKRVYLHCTIVLRQHTQRREGVCEISLFCGEELYSPVLYRCSVQLFSRKSWKQRTCSHRQYFHTAQKQRTRVFFTICSIFVGFLKLVISQNVFVIIIVLKSAEATVVIMIVKY